MATQSSLQNLIHIISKRLTIHGFIVSDFLKERAEEFYSEFPKLVAEGKIQHKEQLYYGIESAEKGLIDTLKGDNIAKPVIVLDGSL